MDYLAAGATGDLFLVTSRFVVNFCKEKCTKYEIENDDIFVTTEGFEISLLLHRL